MRTWVKVGIGVAVAVLLYAGAHEFYLKVYRQTAASRVAAHPMPRLFDQAALAPFAPAVEQQTARATRLMRGWWSTHDTGRHDKQFASWLRQTLPAPPGTAARAAQTRRLAGVARTRTTAGTTAAQWLQTYAGRDLWDYYAQQQGAKLPDAERRTRGRQLRAMLALSKRVGARLTLQLQQPAPFVTDPSLRPNAAAGSTASTGPTRTPGQVCPCSYPSGAATSAAAGSTFLGFLYPAHRAQYRHMTDELGYAQLYLGSRLPSDVDAGALLGDMVGEYFLVTRGEARVGQVAATSS